MSADPSKVNALRKLTEAAEAIGWAASLDAARLELRNQEGRIVATVLNGGIFCAPVRLPVELMALLLEAS